MNEQPWARRVIVGLLETLLVVAIVAAILMVLAVTIDVAFGQSAADIRSRVVESSVLLEIPVMGNGGGDHNTSGRFQHEVEVVRRGGKVSAYRCTGTFLRYRERAFILSAGHCLEDAGITRTEVDDDGKDKKVVEYPDCEFVQNIIRAGRRVGQFRGVAKTLFVSHSEERGGDDVSLLELYAADMARGEAQILAPDRTYDVGDRLYSATALFGDILAGLSEAILSARGYILPEVHPNKPFDVATLTSRPGSSGGGVHVLLNGKPYLCGIITRSDRAGVTLAVPLARLAEALQKAGYGKLCGLPGGKTDKLS